MSDGPIVAERPRSSWLGPHSAMLSGIRSVCSKLQCGRTSLPFRCRHDFTKKYRLPPAAVIAMDPLRTLHRAGAARSPVAHRSTWSVARSEQFLTESMVNPRLSRIMLTQKVGESYRRLAFAGRRSTWTADRRAHTCCGGASV